MLKRLLRMAVPSVMLLGMLSVAAPASASNVFQMTVNGKATLNAFKTIATVSGTYLCTETGGIDFNNSGFGFQLTQIQGKNRVVSGGGGMDPSELNCDGNLQSWSSEVQANDANGNPATWKNGKAAFQGGGGVCDVNNDCAGTNLQVAIRLG
jgi:hypothetical protein